MSNANYCIIRLEQEPWKKAFCLKKVLMKKFYAKNDEDANKYLEQYRKIANKDYKYYWDKYSEISVVDESGKVISTRCRFEDYLNFKWTIWDKITWPFELAWFKLKDFKYWLRDVFYFIKHKQYYRASWALDDHLLDTLQFQIPVLLENKHGISPVYLDKARLELHKDDKKFDLDKYNREHYTLTEEEEKLADKLQKESYEELLLNIKLFRYVEDGYVPYFNDKDEVEFDKKWRSILPIKKGSYDVMDYMKLQKLSTKYWNRIWEWIRLYGRTLWD